MDEKKDYRILASEEQKRLLSGKYKTDWSYLCTAPHMCVGQYCVSKEEGLVLCLSNSSFINRIRCRPVRTT